MRTLRRSFWPAGLGHEVLPLLSLTFSKIQEALKTYARRFKTAFLGRWCFFARMMPPPTRKARLANPGKSTNNAGSGCISNPPSAAG